MNFLRLLALLAAWSTPGVVSFTTTRTHQLHPRASHHHVVRTPPMSKAIMPLFSSTDPNDDDFPDIPLVPDTPSEPEGTQYPLDVPSPILLASSMVLAIVGTGSAFELVNPDPKFGFVTTAILTVVAIPLCLFLFYASILKATAETEADDKEFMKGRY
eukprot:scaffold22612_cov138-Cylindrotheca_fusiformis.AAC.9